MKKLQEYLDYNKIKITTHSLDEYIGTPIVVNYADETESGEDELTIEGEKLWGFTQSEIKEIEIL